MTTPRKNAGTLSAAASRSRLPVRTGPPGGALLSFTGACG
jgi:hypothetical protein